MPDRKSSPLAGGEAAPWNDEQPAASPPAEPGTTTQRTSTARGESGSADITPIREGKRKRSTRQLDDFDLVSFNCNLPVVTRRAVRAFAAEHDADVQDVVNDALIRYLADRGVAVPRTRQERDQS